MQGWVKVFVGLNLPLVHFPRGTAQMYMYLLHTQVACHEARGQQSVNVSVDRNPKTGSQELFLDPWLPDMKKPRTTTSITKYDRFCGEMNV